MAPIDRSARYGRSKLQEDRLQKPTKADMSGALMTDQQADGGDVESMGDATTEESESESDSDNGVLNQKQGSLGDIPSSHAEDILQPLQQTADRVSRQVEDFARRLDHFHSSRDKKRSDVWGDALDLIKAFESMALSRKSKASSDLLEARRLARDCQSSQAVAEEGQVEVQRAEKEAELWHLFVILTALQGPGVRALYAKTDKSCLKDLHGYSSDSDIWRLFCKADRIGMEYQQVLLWLQKSANSSRPHIDRVTESLRTKADQGEGIWSAGWLVTKESIKAQKRNRIWPKPLDPSNPGLENSLRRQSDSERLVAQLDPDAKSREGAALEEADEHHEESAWVACWEMLRRGTSSEAMSEWWSERKENWRAISVGGNIHTSLGEDLRKWNRFVGLWKMNEWAASCFKICRSELVGSKHEAAVYGLLCGDLQVPSRVCQTTDDYVFVHLNAFLIERYREFGKFVAQRESRQSFQPAPAKYEDISRLIQYCQRQEKMAQENRDPLNAMQNAMISKDFHNFFIRQGRALARIASYGGHSSYIIVGDGTREINETAEAIASDPEGLRLTVHLQLVLKSLGFLDDLYAQHEAIAENNVAAYIEWLQQEGKLALIPLYAATMSSPRGARVLAAVLTMVTDVAERDMMVNLMKKYHIDVARVLLNHYQLVAGMIGMTGHENPKTIKAIKVTRSVGVGRLKNIKVKADFFGEKYNDKEELLVQCLDWYRWGDPACWPQICQVACAIYKFLISRGRLAAVRVLCNRVPLAAISKAVLDIELGDPIKSDDGSGDEDDAELDTTFEESRVQPPMSPSKRRRGSRPHSGLIDGKKIKPDRAMLEEQTQTWMHFERLINAMDVLENWHDVSEDFEKSKTTPDSNRFRAMKKLLQASFNDVRINVVDLFEPTFLNLAKSESESHSLTNVRNHYLPECVLAYNSVLYFAGHALRRSTLVDCMNLAQVVATTESLTRAFVDSGRMKELMTAFALSSSAMLHANEQGRAKSGKGQVNKRRDGSGSGVGAAASSTAGGGGGGGGGVGDIEMWQVRPQDVGLVRDKAIKEILGR